MLFPVIAVSNKLNKVHVLKLRDQIHLVPELIGPFIWHLC